jgi:phosphatidylglycerophosphate synthase
MTVALWLLLAQAVLGGFDTLYFHEWRARLPSRGPSAASELRLHAARDFIYAVVFATLPWFAWQGAWAGVFALLLLTEIGITLADFVVEDRVRRPLGGVYPGERVTHALMGILYGGFLAFLVPQLARWWSEPGGLVFSPVGVPTVVRAAMAVMALGVLLSGVRDLLAAGPRPD